MTGQSMLAILFLVLASAILDAKAQEAPQPRSPPSGGDRRAPIVDRDPPKSERRGIEPMQDRKFDAPKAQLLRLIIAGVLGDPASWSLAKTVGVILTVALLLFAVPVFLAWDHARGSGRSVWTWLLIALVTSWMVLPILWLTPRNEEI
jgi:hypothetical protein